MLLCVVNFDPQVVNVSVNIPYHAFEYLQMPELEQCRATDLLTGEDLTLSFVSYRGAEVSVEGYSGKLLKILLP